ncbi:MAG: molybdopterin molybdotransferase MoeA [Clostridia bacterium]|nr:molybdopterin molybdotransferase MoeA [Clostridia bacterium]
MLKNPDYMTARDLLLSRAEVVGTEQVALAACGGRILAAELRASENVPAFDRSAYDGYAFRAADVAAATDEAPITLRVVEEIPAGAFPTKTVGPGEAAKVLTGAPIPEGADTVEKYEATRFDALGVTLSAGLKVGNGIVRTGEDVAKGSVLALPGTRIDAGLAGTLAAQGVGMPLVYRRPRIGIISTGSELVEAESESVPAGKIRNTNRTAFEVLLASLGCEPCYLGLAGDDEREIAALIEKGLADCDALLLTGGVSVGDYDLTPAAMELVGAEILLRGVSMKPGMACCYAVKDGKLLMGLSGNPASSLTNFYAVALPALRKIMGCAEVLPQEITVSLAAPFRKKSPQTRFLRGKLDLTEGTVHMQLVADQGNVVLSSTIGANVMAIVPAGSGPVEEGTRLRGFML